MLKNTTSAFKISIIYLIFSLLWIYFSDNAVNLIINDSEQLKLLQTIKGLFFVTFTSLLLYLLSKQFFNNLQKEKEKLANTNYILDKQQLKSIYQTLTYSRDKINRPFAIKIILGLIDSTTISISKLTRAIKMW